MAPPPRKPPQQRDRSLKVHVKTAHKRSHSSTLWLERQLNDPYIVRAKQEGWRSRAAFKLIEMDDRFHLLKPGACVIDLGAAPGGWSQVAAQRVGSHEGNGKVISIDVLEMGSIPGVLFEQMDFLDIEAPARLHTILGGRADVVLSDMAANTTGHKKTDQLRIIALVEQAAEFAQAILKPGGSFLAKVFQGGTEHTLLTVLKRHFAHVRHVKPAASRAGSSELYVLAQGFRGPSSLPSIEKKESTSTSEENERGYSP